jgi:hypothetical protein
MRNRLLCALGVATVAAALSGCASEQAIGRYLENRRQDLTDVAHVDFSVANAGALAYVGPMALGGSFYTHPETEGEPSHTLQLGLGSVRFLGRQGTAWGLLWFLSKWNEDEPLAAPRPRKKTPTGSSIGLHLGFVFGAAAEVDALEAVDFVVGLVGLDLMKDDTAGTEELEPPAAPDDDEPDETSARPTNATEAEPAPADAAAGADAVAPVENPPQSRLDVGDARPSWGAF